jgi:hypothetical protein
MANKSISSAVCTLGLQLTYSGTLANDKWISLVDETFNPTPVGHFPCQPSQIAAAAADTLHSGSLFANTSASVSPESTYKDAVLTNPPKTVIFDSASLSTGAVFAVCYAEALGTAAATWFDSGLRLRTAKITNIQYGTATTAYPIRTMTSTNLAAATNRLPQATNVVVTYVGALVHSRWISLVDASLQGGNPCVFAAEAAAAADNLHSGAINATTAKVITIPQLTLLNDAKTFTFCYAESYGNSSDTTWKDSYVRVQMSKVKALQTLNVEHVTNGQIASQSRLAVEHVGSLPAGQQLSLVDHTLNNNFPCASGVVAAAAPSVAHSGVVAAVGRIATFNTTAMSTSAIFAACYKSGASGVWQDSGIRLSTPRLIALNYENPIRTLTSSKSELNTLPQEPNLQLTYSGTLQKNKWISIVDASLSGNNPCVTGVQPAAGADTVHSGRMKAAIGLKVFILKQSTFALDPLRNFTVCYAEGDGSATDETWRDSYISITFTRIHSVATHGISITSTGQLARVQGMSLEYRSMGLNAIGPGAWLSLVDQTLNRYQPCKLGSVAAAAADAQHSGSVRATPGTRIVPLTTSGLNTALNFALCYTEALGTASASWTDSAIRLSISKITSIQYGPDSTSFPIRTMISTSDIARTNRLPQVANATLTYVGDLAVHKWISLVDSAMNNNNPCVLGDIAAASADSTHSGPLQAHAGTKVVRVPQSVLLDEEKMFAVCYAETSGETLDTTWRDSYVRMGISKISSISAHGVTHLTNGHIAKVNDLKLAYSGSLATHKWVSLVSQSLNTYDPCANGRIAAAAADTTHSGPMQAGSSGKTVTLDSTGLDTASTVFAVCYAETVSAVYADGFVDAAWSDSGIRLAVTKVSSLRWSSPARVLRSHNVMMATNKLPQALNVAITYTGDLAAGQWLSLVDASLHSQNPCVAASEAADDKDTRHSGAMKATGGSRAVSIPQTPLLKEGVMFTVCYAEDSGNTTDPTWRDTYIRLEVSKIQKITFTPSASVATSVVYTTLGTIPTKSSLALRYDGSLAANKWVSMVDSGLNSNFPCGAGAVAAAGGDQRHTGSLQAGASDKVVTFNSMTLSTNSTFAVCYTESLGNASAVWSDTGIRIEVSAIRSLTYGKGATLGEPIREIFAFAKATDRLPHATPVVFTYHGAPNGAMWVSVVDDSLNSHNPCVVGDIAAADADSTHTGVIQASGSVVKMKQDPALDQAKIYAVCYAQIDGTKGDKWRGTGIRFKLSKLHTLSSSQVSIVTHGHLANSSILQITYQGSLAQNQWFSLVDETLNGNYPCASSSVIWTLPDATHGGALQASGYTITQNTQKLTTAATFAVCYTEAANGNAASWDDRDTSDYDKAHDYYIWLASEDYHIYKTDKKHSACCCQYTDNVRWKSTWWKMGVVGGRFA